MTARGALILPPAQASCAGRCAPHLALPADALPPAYSAPLQHEWFNQPPEMLKLGEMPIYEESHELGMKNKRQAERMQQAGGGAAGDARRQRARVDAGGAGGHAGRTGGQVRPQGAPAAHMPHVQAPEWAGQRR
jgi:hypothetical protein